MKELATINGRGNSMLQAMVASLVLMLLAQGSVFAQYGADIISGHDLSTPEVHLFLDSGLSTPATDQAIWFVGDISGLGVNESPTFDDIQNILSGIGDDKLIFADAVPGLLPPGDPDFYGTYRRPGLTGIDDQFRTAHIWVYLWSDTTPGQVGDTFGLLDLGVRPPPDPGNATWFSTQNIAADVYTVIPEPSTMVLVGLGMLSLLILRRRHTI